MPNALRMMKEISSLIEATLYYQNCSVSLLTWPRYKPNTSKFRSLLLLKFLSDLWQERNAVHFSYPFIRRQFVYTVVT